MASVGGEVFCLEEDDVPPAGARLDLLVVPRLGSEGDSEEEEDVISQILNTGRITKWQHDSFTIYKEKPL